MLRYPRRDTKVYTDTWFARVKSLRGNTCAQVYGTDFHFVKAVAMESKKDAYYSLEEFFRLCGIPAALIPDNAKELIDSGRLCKDSQEVQLSNPTCGVLHLLDYNTKDTVALLVSLLGDYGYCSTGLN
jgi:hypothetical protein